MAKPSPQGAGGAKEELVEVTLKYKKCWTAEQAVAGAKVKSEADAVKTVVDQTGTSARNFYKKAYGGNSILPQQDIDHVVDLQLGGSNTLDKLAPLDKIVNRSLVVQIKNNLKNYPIGTKFCDYKIK